MNFNFRCAFSVLPLALAWCHHPPCRSRRLLSTDAEVVQTLMGCKGWPNHSEGHWSSLPALNACQQAYMCYGATLSLVHNFLGHFQKENSGFGGTLHPSLLGLHRSCSLLLSPDSAEAQTMTHCVSHSPLMACGTSCGGISKAQQFFQLSCTVWEIASIKTHFAFNLLYASNVARRLCVTSMSPCMTLTRILHQELGHEEMLIKPDVYLCPMKHHWDTVTHAVSVQSLCTTSNPCFVVSTHMPN